MSRSLPERVVVTGSLKTDAEPENGGNRELWQKLLRLAPSERVWVAGSTHEKEEELLLAAHAQVRERSGNALLVLVPRKEHGTAAAD